MKSIRSVISFILAVAMVLSINVPNVFAQDVDNNSHTVTFISGGGTKCTIDIYYTQDLTGVGEKDVTVARARNSATGEIDLSGDGQVNFVVNIGSDYNLVDVEIVSGKANFKNLKVIEINDVDKIYSYRMTKITGNVTVRINTELSLYSMDSDQIKEKILSRAANVPRNYKKYCTERSANKLTEMVDAANDLVNVELNKDELITLYLLLDDAIENLEYKSASVPQVYIDTKDNNGSTLTKANGYVESDIVIVDENSSVIKEHGQIKVRGNSTAMAPKKPYGIRFDTKQDVFGMGAAKKWVLLANCFDPTMLRNEMCFDLARKMDMPYTPDSKFVELYLDGKLLGMYQLTEAVEVDKQRVDIDVENGDFLIELEKTRVEVAETYIRSVLGNRFVIKAPENPSVEQQQYIKSVMDQVEEAIKSKDFSKVEKIVDVDSFVKLYLLNEVALNNDYGSTSVNFFYKNGKLYAGPAWDFDRTFGIYEIHKPTNMQAVYFHYSMYLMEYPQYQQMIVDAFEKYNDDIKYIYDEGGLIDSLVSENSDAIYRNYNEAGWDVSYPYLQSAVTYSTYQESVDAIKSWLIKRHEHLNSIFNEEYLFTPTTLSANANDDSITVTWNEVEGADSYKILRGAKPGSWTTIASKVYGTSYTDYTAEPEVKYYYKVTARYGSKASKPYGDGENATIHTYSYSTTEVEANCVDDGAIIYECTCGDVKREITRPALGHAFVGLPSGNSYIFKCSDCDYSKLVANNKLIAYWSIEYLNKAPNRSVDNSCYLDVVKDGIINAKDYALLKHMAQ